MAAWAALALLTAGAAGCVTAGGASERAVIRAKNRVAPALVHIRPVQEVYARGKREEVVTIGSGFIISPEGYVCTNEHVIGQSRTVACILSDRSEVEAEVVGVDPYTDIGVLKLKMEGPLPYVKLGDSARIESGQTVMALGSPHGLARSVSLGIVSVTDRHLDVAEVRTSPFNNWIQTDAAINPGNSGGPLVNLRGEVIGVNARMLRGAENVGFAIPINVAKEVIDAILREGRVRRSWVGISLQEMMAKTDDPAQRGVVISDIDPLSPASEAGLRPGDVLAAVNGVAVDARFPEDLPPIRKRITSLPIGEKAVFTVMRGDQTLDLAVLTEDAGEFRGTEREFPEWGFTAGELTLEQVRRAQLPARMGIMVSGVQVGGIAASARLDQGDIVLEMDNEAIENLAHFTRLYEAAVAARKSKVLLRVKRGALTRFVLIKQEAAATLLLEDTDGHVE